MSALILLLLMHDDPTPLSPERAVALEKAIVSVVGEKLPKPLYKGSSHWGRTTRTVNGIKWVGDGAIKKPVIQYAEKNHGTWRRYEVDLLETASEPLKLRLSNGMQTGKSELSFDLRLDADLRFKIDQENWSHGVKLFDGAARGTVHFTVVVKCESKMTFETGPNFLPMIKYRFRVVQATPSYSHLKFTHIPGLGGEAAEKLGKWGHDVFVQVKPSVERKLLDKLTAKIIKAADTKEVQISLSGVERKK